MVDQKAIVRPVQDRRIGASARGRGRAIKDGVSALSIKAELLSLERRKAELRVRLEAPEMPELPHPRMKGDLAGMLSAARDSKRSPDTGDLLVQIKLVAGARNPLNLEFAWSAA
jgi:hypothetical protein